MKLIACLSVSLALVLAVGPLGPRAVSAQTSDAPCGRDQYGNPLQCVRPGPSENLESACLTTGRLENCVPYHQNSCFVGGFQTACRLYTMGRNCYGGDQRICSLYVSLLRANTACALDRNQNACDYLRQQGYL